MSLRQVNSIPFPYRDKLIVNSVATLDAAYFEFERTTFLHSLSIYSDANTTISVKFSYPSTFTHGGETSNDITIFTGVVGTLGLFMAPGAISSSPVTPTAATAPLPAAFPEGSILRVDAAYAPTNNAAEIQIFLIASG